MARSDGTWADHCRHKWKWDRVTWGTHEVDCYPAGCSWRVFTKDGKILREEQAGSFPQIKPGHVKPLGLVNRYGHLTYRPLSWQPIPADRAVRVDIEKLARGTSKVC
jgi:nitrate reductase alpha subunit